jgi:hypothetical protein
MGGPAGPEECPLPGSSRDTLARRYRGQILFLFVYCQETHPEGENDMNPRTQVAAFRDLPPLTRTRTWAERAARARLFREWTKTPRRVLVDEDGAGSAFQRYGGFGNVIVVVDRQGRIALRTGGSTSILASCLEGLTTRDH